MAVAFSPEGVESCGETAATGGSLPVVVWTEEGSGEIEGFSVRVLICRPLLKVEALKKGAKFEAEFGSDALVSAGMDARLALDDYIDTLRSALLAERSEVSSRVLADASAVVWIVAEKMGRRTFEYRLELRSVEMGESDSLPLELAETKEELAETKQQKMDAAVPKGDATQKQLVAATTKTEALEQPMAASKTELVETKEELAVSKTEIERLLAALAKSKAESTEELAKTKTENERLRAALTKSTAESTEEIRFRDACIRKLEKVCAKPVSTTVAKKSSTQFRFDTSIFGGETIPSQFEVSADGKSANAKEIYAQLVLTPALSSDCQLKLVVEKKTRTDGFFTVGITDDYSKLVIHGCAFKSNGTVWVNWSRVAVSQPFGDWRTGDRLLLKAHLSSGTVTIESRTGKYTAKWKPKKEPIYFAVICFGRGGTLRIE